MQKMQGFNLFEMLISLTIISLLSSIAISNYANHLSNEKRLEAAVILNKVAIALEEYNLSHHSYAGATLRELNFTDLIVKNSYQLQLSATEQNYLLQAIPQSKQAESDTQCGTLGLDSAGVKSISGFGKIENCW